MSAEFVKHDADRPRFDLIDSEFELALAKLLAHGARKYAPENWKLASPAEAIPRYRAALRRHENAAARGETIDRESGVSHWVCVACNSMFLAWFERQAAAVPEHVPAQLELPFTTSTWSVPLAVPK